jgi:hypothetical protein
MFLLLRILFVSTTPCTVTLTGIRLVFWVLMIEVSLIMSVLIH